MASASVGVQSALNTQSSPVIPNSNGGTMPHVWTWIWFVLAVLIIMGFHIRMFGHPVPPAANFP
jgi:hypothetical protein